MKVNNPFWSDFCIVVSFSLFDFFLVTLVVGAIRIGRCYDNLDFFIVIVIVIVIVIDFKIVNPVAYFSVVVPLS